MTKTPRTRSKRAPDLPKRGVAFCSSSFFCGCLIENDSVGSLYLKFDTSTFFRNFINLYHYERLDV